MAVYLSKMAATMVGPKQWSAIFIKQNMAFLVRV